MNDRLFAILFLFIYTDSLYHINRVYELGWFLYIDAFFCVFSLFSLLHLFTKLKS